MLDVTDLTEEFKASQKILNALGDENRQQLILEILKMEKGEGVRVGQIAEVTHMSRPAVSHHVQILKEAGLVMMRREGTRNYYYFDAETKAMDQLLTTLMHAKERMREVSDRGVKKIK